jgi:hypothetical protein
MKLNINLQNYENKFSTSDLGIATALVSLGYEVPLHDKSNPTKVIFIFEDRNNINEAVKKFWSNQLPVDARTFFENTKMLKSRIWNDF